MTNDLTLSQLFGIQADNWIENTVINAILAYEGNPETFRKRGMPIAIGYRETFTKMLEEMNRWGAILECTSP